jgi:cysteine synthase A
VSCSDQQRIFSNISETIGHTPLVRVRNLPVECQAEVVAKLECFNPLSSVKDRIAKAMIDDAEKSGKLRPGMRIVEPTSGNTGIGLAFVAAARGYPITLVMPESMSMERRLLLKLLGAELVLSPAVNGMKGAIAVATRMAESDATCFMPQQFKNGANPEIHYQTTAEEIWSDTAGAVDIVVAGVGTGGTITGVGRKLKERKPGVRIVAVEPRESPVLSGGTPGPHKIQGIGAGFVPDILDTKLIDEIVQVSAEEAVNRSLETTAQEGIPMGISSGAALQAAIRIGSRPENKGKMIVVIFPSGIERYLSTVLAEKARAEVAALAVTQV